MQCTVGRRHLESLVWLNTSFHRRIVSCHYVTTWRYYLHLLPYVALLPSAKSYDIGCVNRLALKNQSVIRKYQLSGLCHVAAQVSQKNSPKGQFEVLEGLMTTYFWVFARRVCKHSLD